MIKIVCDMCGKEFNYWDTESGFSLSRNFGYGSKYDLEGIECDLCCECFDKLLDEYLIPNCKHPIMKGPLEL